MMILPFPLSQAGPNGIAPDIETSEAPPEAGDVTSSATLNFLQAFTAKVDASRGETTPESPSPDRLESSEPFHLFIPAGGTQVSHVFPVGESTEMDREESTVPDPNVASVEPVVNDPERIDRPELTLLNPPEVGLEEGHSELPQGNRVVVDEGLPVEANDRATNGSSEPVSESVEVQPELVGSSSPVHARGELEPPLEAISLPASGHRTVSGTDVLTEPDALSVDVEGLTVPGARKSVTNAVDGHAEQSVDPAPSSNPANVTNSKSPQSDASDHSVEIDESVTDEGDYRQEYEPLIPEVDRHRFSGQPVENLVPVSDTPRAVTPEVPVGVLSEDTPRSAKSTPRRTSGPTHSTEAVHPPKEHTASGANSEHSAVSTSSRASGEFAVGTGDVEPPSSRRAGAGLPEVVERKNTGFDETVVTSETVDRIPSVAPEFSFPGSEQNVSRVESVRTGDSPVALQETLSKLETWASRQVGGTGPFRLLIESEELGVIRVDVSGTGGEFRAEIDVQSRHAQSLLSEHLDHLKRSLTRQGLAVDHIDISLDGVAKETPTGTPNRPQQGEGFSHQPDTDRGSRNSDSESSSGEKTTSEVVRHDEEAAETPTGLRAIDMKA